MARLSGYGLIALALLVTLGMNWYTLVRVARARTSVPWWDQWVVVQELAQHARGAPLWPTLWSLYYGHRMVIPRLLFLADARWFSLASLTWLTLLFQFVHIALLMALAWLLLGRRPPAPFMIAVLAILNLMLSPLQMENFVWGMQTMFPLVFVAATGAFLCLSLAGDTGRGALLALSVACGIVSSYTMPNGILVWPVLAAQAIYLKRKPGVVMAFALAGAVAIGSYLRHYTRPVEFGMGVGGMLRHPVDAAGLLGCVLGNPLGFSLRGDALAGIVVLALTGYLLVRALRTPVEKRRWLSALASILVFSFLGALSLVAGRLTPKILRAGSNDYLGGQYFTLICVFWAGTALLALHTIARRKPRVPWICFYGVLFVWVMFSSVPRQLVAADDWADFFLGVDAAGSAILLDAPDEQLLSRLWPNPAERGERIAFLRQHRLAMFHEPRAGWPGQRVADLFPAPAGLCSGAIERTTSLDGSSWRVQGWAWDTGRSKPPDDILFADLAGSVIGMARGGLRHGYIPGLLIEPQPAPPPHARFPRGEWLGYVRRSGDAAWAQVSLYGVFRSEGRVCTIR